jgi:hypothetical protein
LGAGIEFFFNDKGKVTTSLALSLAFHHINMNESGLLNQSPYHRFYKLDQCSFSVQHNILFRTSRKFQLAWVSRLILENNFKSQTDYLPGEKFNAGLRDNKMNVLLCLAGVYAQLKPLNKIPLYLNGQIFNDMALWNHPSAKYELGRTYVKGSGVSVGLTYIFKK